MKKFAILFFTILLACSPELYLNPQQTFNQDEKLISTQRKMQLKEEGAVLSNFIVKHHLDGNFLYLMGQQFNEVSAYNIEDSSYQSFQYNKRPVEISDFYIGSDKLFLLSGYSKAIFVLDKTDGSVLREIRLNIKKHHIEYRMGESLFHFNEKDDLFFFGLKGKSNASSIELVGAFDNAGQLQFTFGDFKKDNGKAKPGYLLSNDGIRSQLSNSTLYILKKETSHLYQFDLKGNLSHSKVLDFIKLPSREKVKVKGKSILKDQVMDFRVDESTQEIVYTFFTNTGEFFGEKQPDIYLAYKKLKADTITYTKVDFFKLIEFTDKKIWTIPFNRDSDSKYLTQFMIEGI